MELQYSKFDHIILIGGCSIISYTVCLTISSVYIYIFNSIEYGKDWFLKKIKIFDKLNLRDYY